MRSSTKRILSILFSGIFLIATITVVVNYIFPALNEVTEKRSTLYSKEQFLNNQANAIEGVQGLINSFQEFSELQETVNQAIPTSENTTQILNQVDVISRASGVLLESIDVTSQTFLPSERPLHKRLGSMNVVVDAQGGYDNLKTFLEFLENNVRVFEINEFSIAPIGDVGLSSNYKITLLVETFFQEN
ncbi:MAG: hypothetical protein WD471_00050 [Candidatus Paceibacterota bacterium]